MGLNTAQLLGTETGVVFGGGGVDGALVVPARERRDSAGSLSGEDQLRRFAELSCSLDYDDELDALPNDWGHCFLHVIKPRYRVAMLVKLGRRPSLYQFVAALRSDHLDYDAFRSAGMYRVDDGPPREPYVYHVAYKQECGFKVGHVVDYVAAVRGMYPELRTQHIDCTGAVSVVAHPQAPIGGGLPPYSASDPGVVQLPDVSGVGPCRRCWFAKAAAAVRAADVPAVGCPVLVAPLRPPLTAGLGPEGGRWRKYQLTVDSIVGFEPGGEVEFPGLTLHAVESKCVVVARAGTVFWRDSRVSVSSCAVDGGVHVRAMAVGDYHTVVVGLGRGPGAVGFVLYGCNFTSGYCFCSSVKYGGEYRLSEDQYLTFTVTGKELCGLSLVSPGDSLLGLTLYPSTACDVWPYGSCKVGYGFSGKPTSLMAISCVKRARTQGPVLRSLGDASVLSLGTSMGSSSDGGEDREPYTCCGLLGLAADTVRDAMRPPSADG